MLQKRRRQSSDLLDQFFDELAEHGPVDNVHLLLQGLLGVVPDDLRRTCARLRHQADGEALKRLPVVSTGKPPRDPTRASRCARLPGVGSRCMASRRSARGISGDSRGCTSRRSKNRRRRLHELRARALGRVAASFSQNSRFSVCRLGRSRSTFSAACQMRCQISSMCAP
jgi:hypothetical protein